jgi:hypothetical protein
LVLRFSLALALGVGQSVLASTTSKLGNLSIALAGVMAAAIAEHTRGVGQDVEPFSEMRRTNFRRTE